MLNNVGQFLDRLFSELAAVGLDVSSYEMDHVCYRVETLERYEELAHVWSRYATDTHESLVNGRPIMVFTLWRPPTFHDRAIGVVELPAPKEGSDYVEGWEHAEFVIDEPFEALMARYPRLRFDTKSLGKALNPELGLKLGDGLQVKFHHKPLAEVIKIERAQGLALPDRFRP